VPLCSSAKALTWYWPAGQILLAAPNQVTPPWTPAGLVGTAVAKTVGVVDSVHLGHSLAQAAGRRAGGRAGGRAGERTGRGAGQGAAAKWPEGQRVAWVLLACCGHVATYEKEPASASCPTTPSGPFSCKLQRQPLLATYSDMPCPFPSLPPSLTHSPARVHTHLPAWQVAPAPHELPHAPQLFESVLVLTQPETPGHVVWGATHSGVHVPPTHLAAEPHALPHCMQWQGSEGRVVKAG